MNANTLAIASAPGLQLPSLPHPQAIFPSFTSSQTSHIKLCERLFSWSGDSFDITLHPSAQPILQVEGTAFSLSHRKRVLDMAGNHLYTLRKRPLSIPPVYYAEDGQGKPFFEVASQWSLGHAKAVATFTYQDQTTGEAREARWIMKGEFLDRRVEIRDEVSGGIIAVIDRDYWNAAQVLGGLQTYVVTVAPGVDVGLVVAMSICLDERHKQPRGGERGVGVGLASPFVYAGGMGRPVVNETVIVNGPVTVNQGGGGGFNRGGAGVFNNPVVGPHRPGIGTAVLGGLALAAGSRRTMGAAHGGAMHVGGRRR